MLQWRCVVETNPGCQRQTNQDACYGNERLFVVCDGAGSVVSGRHASQLAVTTIANIWRKNPAHSTDGAAIRQWIADAINSANEAIYTSANGDASLRGMTSTIVIAVQSIVNKFIEIAHVGDSRAYLFRPSLNNKCPLFLLTDDHTEIAKTVNREPNPYRNMITRSLGQKSKVEASYTTVHLTSNDWIVLCSDGLTTVLLDEQIGKIIWKSATPRGACKKLIDETIEGGAPDNVTVIAIQYYEKNSGDEEPTAPVPLNPKPKQEDTEISLALPGDQGKHPN
jgi:serine/threonine protein phosphatase PrpC